MNQFRRVQYVREEYQEGEPYEGSLLTFVFDIPYFPPCGVFPPFHLFNQFLASGGSTGGMGPGATWEPFSITDHEYADLVDAIKSLTLDDIKLHARYAWLKPVLDSSLDHIDLYLEWMMAVRQKHRTRYRQEMQALGRKKESD